jgi:hypothetical protein
MTVLYSPGSRGNLELKTALCLLKGPEEPKEPEQPKGIQT